MDKLEFKKLIRQMRIREGFINELKPKLKLKTPKVKKQLLSYTPKNSGEIMKEWYGYKLKNKGKINLHHYRRNGLLYLVIKTDKGLVHEINDRVSYPTIENSTCPISSSMNKNSNHSQNMQLDKNFLR